ncbi:MAG: transglutaminase domain-containing protein [Lachnospiraceae bacterium]
MRKQYWTMALALMLSVMFCIPVMAEETEEYPLAGTGIIEYQEMTGFEWGGSGEVESFQVIRMDGIYSQVNNLYYHDGVVWGSLAKPVDFDNVFIDGNFADDMRAVRAEVIRFLNSFDWKNASEYERAERAALWIAENHTPEFDENGWQINSTGREGAYPILGAKKGGVCRNYCAAYQLLCRSVGLNCLEYGTSMHAWNDVQIDGVWRKIDLYGLTGGWEKAPEEIKRFLDTPTEDDLTIFGEGFENY